MHESNWRELCAFTSSVWGRELTNAQKAAGWKLLAAFPDEAVEKAIVVIAESGREQLPPWSLVYKTAEGIANAERELNPVLALPAGDSLTDLEHQAAMIRLRARQTPEQMRRATRVVRETAGMAMSVRLHVSHELLTGGNARLTAELWDALADEIIGTELGKLQPLISQGRALHE